MNGPMSQRADRFAARAFKLPPATPPPPVEVQKKIDVVQSARQQVLKMFGKI